jgi:hypothetical protein
MKKLKEGQITILFNENGLEIKLRDPIACVTFAEITLTPEQTCQAFSRLAHTPCQIVTYGLEKIGKKMEHKSQTFHIGSTDLFYTNDRNINRKTIAQEVIKKQCPKGWTPELYFGSQDSFYTENGQLYARTIIRRWVDSEE